MQHEAGQAAWSPNSHRTNLLKELHFMILSKLKHQAKLALYPEYRSNYPIKKEVERIQKIFRYTRLSKNLLGSKLELVDSLSS